MEAGPLMNLTANLSVDGNQTHEMQLEERISAALWAYAGIVIIVVGTIGHILSISVLVTSKTMRTQSSTVYLITMAVAGLVSLYTGLLRYIITVGITDWKFDFRLFHDALCKMHMMFSYGSLQFFAWMQATVAVDRLVSIVVPHKYMTSCKWKLGLVVVFVELVAVLALNSAVLASVALREAQCIAIMPEFFPKVWSYLDFVSFSLVPAVVMCVCNVSILYLLKKNRMTSRSHRDITIMLMSLNVFFIITTLPISIIFFVDWGDWPEKKFFVTELVWTVFSLIQYMGAAGTFFIYCLTGSKFREELRRLFRMKPRATGRRPQTSATGSTQIQQNRQYDALKVSMTDVDDNTSVVSL